MVRIKIIEGQPALIMEAEKRHLIISDLHIGFEHKFSSNKIFLGKNSATMNIVNDIKKLIQTENVESIILLGDIKSGIEKISKNEWNDIPQFFDEIKKNADITLVPGNHDANIQKLIPSEISITSSNGIIIDDVLLTHGHVMPSKNFSNVRSIIMGHIHPVFFQENSLVNGQRVWISLKTKKQFLFPSTIGEIEITVLPSYNPYFYASTKKLYKKSISPIIQKIKNKSIAKIITLDGTIIGNEAELEYLV